MEQEFEDLGLNSIEEAAELIKAIGKARNYGLESRNPLIPDSPTNREQIEEEAADTKVMIDLMCDAGMIRRDRVEAWMPIKRAKKLRVMELQRVLRKHDQDQTHPEVQEVLLKTFGSKK